MGMFRDIGGRKWVYVFSILLYGLINIVSVRLIGDIVPLSNPDRAAPKH